MNKSFMKKTITKKEFSLTYRKAASYIIFFLLALIFVSLITLIINFLLEGTILKSVIIILNVLPFILTILWAFYRAKKNHVVLKFSFYPAIKLFPVLLLLTFCMLMLSSYLTTLIPHDQGFLKEFYDKFNGNIKYLMNPKWLLIVAACIFAPIFEEMFFRGLLLNGLLNRAKNIQQVWRAILFTSFIFGLIHVNPWQFIAGVISGIALGYVYYRTKSLMNSIFIHALNNGLSVFILIQYGDLEPVEIANYPKYYNFLFLTGFIICLFLVHFFTAQSVSKNSTS